MQKVYLILRNNKQSGPHSLDELLELGLKGDDLIWVEGKSFSWSFPAEIETLKPYLSAEPDRMSSAEKKQAEVTTTNKSAALKKVFVNLPGKNEKEKTKDRFSEQTNDALERKAEELRKRAESYLQQKAHVEEEKIVETKYTKSLNDMEAEYTSWVYDKVAKKKKFNKKPFLLLAAIVVSVAATYLIFQSKFSVNEGRQNALPAQSATSMPLDDIKNNSVANQPDMDVAAREEIKAEDKIASANSVKTLQRTIAKEKTSKVLAKSSIPVAKEPFSEEQPNKTDNRDRKEAEIESQSSTTDVSSAEKKKTLKEKIGGFFEQIKTKKSAEATTEDFPGATSPTAGSERKAAKRGEETQNLATTDLSSYVQVSANQASANWMMGVRGLKVVLRNNGNHPIKKAIVEVSYYNDQNDLLDKKQVQFSNIPAKKSGTQTAPDHRLADHADVRLISATGNANNTAN